MRNLRNSKGFTLIELMIVVVIIGILAAIAIPKFTQVSNGAKQAEAEPILKQICSLAESEFLRTGTWPTTNLTGLNGWADPAAQHFQGWALGTGGTDGAATATATVRTAGLRVPTMDCGTKQITYAAPAAAS